MTKTKREQLQDQVNGLNDPEPGRDGGCAVCGNPRPPMAEKHGDPFCSATCARMYFEVKGA